jgi:hypothetical protein
MNGVMAKWERCGLQTRQERVRFSLTPPFQPRRSVVGHLALAQGTVVRFDPGLLL